MGIPYFFLDFIPTLGFSIALIPPTFITLLMQGWKRALLVGCGLILTNLIVDNIVMPMFAKHELSISFLEITLSLVGWAFLFGLPGAVMAIPMTLALKELIAKNSSKGSLRKRHQDDSLGARLKSLIFSIIERVRKGVKS